MLAFGDDSLKPDAWAAAEYVVELPESMRPHFFERRGPVPLHHQNSRSYHRYYMRAKALVDCDDTVLGAYTKDISREGIGFLSPLQLLPLDRVKLRLPNRTELTLEIARCRRVDKSCYDCGARFVLDEVKGR